MTIQVVTNPIGTPNEMPSTDAPENPCMHNQTDPDAATAVNTARRRVVSLNPATRAPIHMSAPARNQRNANGTMPPKKSAANLLVSSLSKLEFKVSMQPSLGVPLSRPDSI